MTASLSDPNWGRYDPTCVGKPIPADMERCPVISDEDGEAMREWCAEGEARLASTRSKAK